MQAGGGPKRQRVHGGPEVEGMSLVNVDPPENAEAEVLMECIPGHLERLLEQYTSLSGEAVEHRAFADRSEVNEFVGQIQKGEARPVGMITFPYPRKAQERKVERAYWYELVGELSMRFVTVHAHFEGSWDTFRRQKAQGVADNDNSALKYITQINVRHAHSALLKQFHRRRMDPDDKERYHPAMYEEEEFFSEQHPWRMPVFAEDYGFAISTGRWDWRADADAQAGGFAIAGVRQQLAPLLAAFHGHPFEAVRYNALSSGAASDGSGGGGSGSGGGGGAAGGIAAASANIQPASSPVNAISLWRRGVIAIGRVQSQPHASQLLGTGFLVDGPLGLIATCAHNVLSAWFEGDSNTLDPGGSGVAIGVAGSGDVPTWCGVADVVRYSPPDSGYPYIPPAHWAFAKQPPGLMPERLDLAILRLRAPCTIENLPVAAPARALSLGRSAKVIEGDPLVMLGYGQVGGSGGSAEGTSTTTRGVASGTFYTTASGGAHSSELSTMFAHTDSSPRAFEQTGSRLILSFSAGTVVGQSLPTLARWQVGQ